MAPLVRVIGSLNVDMVSVTPRFPDAGETITASSYFMSAGGKGANQAVASGRASRSQATPGKSAMNVEMVGAVGGLDGHFDALLKPTLEKSGVDTSRVQIVAKGYTGVAVIIVDSGAGGENRILFSPGANYEGMQAKQADVLGLGLTPPMPDVIVMQGEIPVDTTIGIMREMSAFKARNRAAGKRGIEAGPDVVFNPAPAPPGGLPEDVYAAVDHFIMNETEADLMTPPGDQLRRTVPDADGLEKNEKVARYFHLLGVSYVIITLGSQGSWYSATDAGTCPESGNGSNRRFTNTIPADKVSQVLDTTAAGDTFVGAYAVEVAQWRESRRAAGQAAQDVTDAEKPIRYQKITEQAMKQATRAAARCVERQGAMDSIPWRDELGS